MTLCGSLVNQSPIIAVLLPQRKNPVSRSGFQVENRSIWYAVSISKKSYISISGIPVDYLSSEAPKATPTSSSYEK